MAEDGLTAAAAAVRLGRSEQATRTRASDDRISFHGKRDGKTAEEKTRERWIAMLPAMKTALRRDIEINIYP
jgi:ribosomal protein L19E